MSKVINIFGDNPPRAEQAIRADPSENELVEIESEEAMEELQQAFRNEMDLVESRFNDFLRAMKKTVTFQECANVLGGVFQRNFVERYEELMDFEFIPEGKDFYNARRDLVKLLAGKYNINGISVKKKDAAGK